jgi:NADPH:quinone reductase-like Zn-dependent oxidoreductase
MYVVCVSHAEPVDWKSLSAGALSCLTLEGQTASQISATELVRLVSDELGDATMASDAQDVQRGGSMYREILASNVKAQRASVSALTQALCDVYREQYGRSPSPDERSGMHDAAEWIKEGQVGVRRVTRGIQDGTWLPEEGPTQLFSGN